MKSTVKIFCALAALACAAPTQARSVADFLTAYQRVRDGGMSAMFGSEARSLMDEANQVLSSWKDQQAAARPRVCAPAGSEDMDPAAFVKLLTMVPEKKRSSTSVRSGVIASLNRVYRCR